MKITIEISDFMAACLWANGTYSGKYPRGIEEVAAEVLIIDARSFADTFPKESLSALDKYKSSAAGKGAV